MFKQIRIWLNSVIIQFLLLFRVEMWKSWLELVEVTSVFQMRWDRIITYNFKIAGHLGVHLTHFLIKSLLNYLVILFIMIVIQSFQSVNLSQFMSLVLNIFLQTSCCSLLDHIVIWSIIIIEFGLEMLRINRAITLLLLIHVLLLLV